MCIFDPTGMLENKYNYIYASYDKPQNCVVYVWHEFFCT